LIVLIESNRGNRVQGIKEIVLINDLHQQGLSISAIARKVGCDRKTVKKYIERGLEAPCYGPRAARSTVLDPYTAYLTERVAAFPDLSRRRLLRENPEHSPAPKT
jgi:transposase